MSDNTKMSHTSSPCSGMLNRKLREFFAVVCTRQFKYRNYNSSLQFRIWSRVKTLYECLYIGKNLSFEWWLQLPNSLLGSQQLVACAYCSWASRIANHNHKFKLQLWRWIPVKFHSNYSENYVFVCKNVWNHLLGGEAYVTLGHLLISVYTQTWFLSITRILKTNHNHHCNDHSTLRIFSWVWGPSF